MSVLEAAIGWLAPPQCISCQAEGLVLCQNCATSDIRSFGERCAFCTRLSPHSRTCEHCRRSGTPRFVWITTTHDATAQELVEVFKFGHLRAAAAPLASLMSQTYYSYNEINESDSLIVPLPTATSRMRQRGFDHSALLAKTLARKLDLEYCQALGRLGQSRQVGASRQLRLTQNNDNYFVRQPHRLVGRNILLIDDVTTTGASIIAASQVLRAAGAAHKDALVFAKRL